ncbi:MAG TPA: hypothetical protein VEG25_09120 [Burkholderiales bacterium]|nr:hypothetical protein [Burkholderiales bacterium]
MKWMAIIALTVGWVAACIGNASAEWSWNTGIEYFQWRESTAPSVTERGGLFTLGLNWTLDKESGLLPAYRGKLYVGGADYEGAFLFTNQPTSDVTSYVGITNEVQAIYRTLFNAAPYSVDYIAGVGWDYWVRSVGANTDNPQEEDWSVAYGRLGFDINSRTEHGVFGGGGIKYPFYTSEDANFTDAGFAQNPTLHPGKLISGYAQIGYRFESRSDLILYYDGYRFSQSNTVALTSPFAPGVIFFAFQPKSVMTIIGLKYQHSF